MKLFSQFRNDPRLLQAPLLWTYAFAAREWFNHERPHYVLLVTFIATYATELLVGWFRYKKITKPLPALIICPSITTLCYSPEYSFYVCAGILASLSKGFLLEKGRHVFNPSNFGICALILLFPNWFTGITDTFSGLKLVSGCFLISGLFNAWNSKTLSISVSYLVAMYLCFAARGFFFDWNIDPSTFVAFCINPVILIYAFHMINDPATAPKNLTPRIIYGTILGCSVVTLGYYGITNSHFISLFVLSGLLVPFKDYLNKKTVPNPI